MRQNPHLVEFARFFAPTSVVEICGVCFSYFITMTYPILVPFRFSDASQDVHTVAYDICRRVGPRVLK